MEVYGSSFRRFRSPKLPKMRSCKAAEDFTEPYGGLWLLIADVSQPETSKLRSRRAAEDLTEAYGSSFRRFRSLKLSKMRSRRAAKKTLSRTAPK